MRNSVYKILRPDEWVTTQRLGEFTGSTIDQNDGFIHLSAANQLEMVVKRHFAAEPNLILLQMDVPCLGDQLRWEPSRFGEEFPHFYGRLSLDMVRNAFQLTADRHGEHSIPAAIFDK